MRDILANVCTEHPYYVVANTLLAPVIHTQIVFGHSPHIWQDGLLLSFKALYWQFLLGKYFSWAVITNPTVSGFKTRAWNSLIDKCLIYQFAVRDNIFAIWHRLFRLFFPSVYKAGLFCCIFFPVEDSLSSSSGLFRCIFPNISYGVFCQRMHFFC